MKDGYADFHVTYYIVLYSVTDKGVVAGTLPREEGVSSYGIQVLCMDPKMIQVTRDFEGVEVK